MANLLLVGSDRERTAGIRSLLRQDAHRVTILRTVDQWRDVEREVRPELIIATSDFSDGVLTRRARPMRGFPAPLLFVQFDAEIARDIQLDERLVDCVSSPFMQEELLARVDALVRVRRVIHHDPAAAQPTASRSARRPGALGERLVALLGARIPRPEKPLTPYLEVAARVAEWADRRDAFEPGHAERVTSLCSMMAEGLGVGDHEVSALLRAAMLHDIGKVSVPVDILHQQAPLEESQMRLIRAHPRRGAALMRALDRDEEVADTILYHHERPNGGGYYGLDGDRIPRSARILAVAEVFDAMTNCRIRERVSPEVALGRLPEIRGEILDADCVDALVDKLRPRPRSIPLAPRPDAGTTGIPISPRTRR